MPRKIELSVSGIKCGLFFFIHKKSRLIWIIFLRIQSDDLLPSLWFRSASLFFQQCFRVLASNGFTTLWSIFSPSAFLPYMIIFFVCSRNIEKHPCYIYIRQIKILESIYWIFLLTNTFRFLHHFPPSPLYISHSPLLFGYNFCNDFWNNSTIS